MPEVSSEVLDELRRRLARLEAAAYRPRRGSLIRSRPPNISTDPKNGSVKST